MTRRKDGRWQEAIAVRQNGRLVRRYIYGKTKAEVLRKIASLEEEAERERERGRTYREVSAEWWDEVAPTLAVNTLRGYRPAVARADEYFGSWHVKEIRPSDINQFIRSFVRTFNAADKTARTQLSIISMVCKFAVANGYMDSNPARDISVPKGLKKETRTMPSEEDIVRVKNSINCTFGLFAYLIMYTGCRRGEALALTWEDIDMDKRTIRISKSVYQDSNTPRLKAPKTASGIRTIPLLDRLWERLKPSKGLVFPNKYGKYMTEMQFQRAWAQYTEQSGVSCTPHQLRHLYATMLYEAGINEKLAQDLLGHAQISTTRDIYTHIREAHRKDAFPALLGMDI